MKLASLFLAALILIAAGILPTCGGICCPRSADANAVMHREMPCCEPGASVAPREAVRLQPATFSNFTQTPAPAILTSSEPSQPSRVCHTSPLSDERGRPSAPLFLRNAQLLI